MRFTACTGCGLALSAVLAIAAPQTDSWVHGTVYERTGQTVRPLPRAFVSVSTSGGELLVTARTDDQGRFQLSNIPMGRFVLEAAKPGYRTRQAAGHSSERAILDCSKGCRQSGLDFELSRGAVLAGVALDSMRDPMIRASVTLLRRTGSDASTQKPATALTDDHGQFRIAGLAAGSYQVEVRWRGPGGHEEILTRALDLKEGEEITDLALTAGNQASFRVSGRVTGIPLGDGYKTSVEIRPVTGSARGISSAVDADGRFQFEAVPAGRYGASASTVKLDIVERTDYFLNVIDVAGDTDQIALQPVGAASASGAVEVAAGVQVTGSTVRFTSKEGFGSHWTRLPAAGRQFEVSGMRPGTYRVHTDSGKFYVKGVKVGGELTSPTELVLAPGLNQVTIVLAADQGQLAGTVRDPQTALPLDNARVVLRGDRAEYSVQTDQRGRFLFGMVIPGDYRICAWGNIAVDGAGDQATWEQPGCQSNVVRIAPSSQNEIELRAAP